MFDQDHWASLRQYLSAPSGFSTFQRIVSLLERTEGGESDDIELMIEYSDAHLQHWTPWRREVSLGQLWPGWPLGEAKAYAPLVRSLSCPLSMLREEALVEALQAQFPQIRGLALRVEMESDLWADYPSWPQIEHLHIRQNRYGSQLLSFIFRGELFPSLRSLNLASAYLGDGGFSGILRRLDRAQLQQLTALDLSYNDLSQGNVLHLASMWRESQFDSLRLSFNPVGAEGVARLLYHGSVRDVRSLRLLSTQIGRELATYITEPPTFHRLEDLRLDHNGLDVAAFFALRPWRKMPALRYLSLAANELDDGDATLLVERLDEMPHLEYLDVSFNQIGYHGLCVLLEAAHAHPAMRAVQLRGNPGFRHVVQGQLLSLLLEHS